MMYLSGLTRWLKIFSDNRFGAGPRFRRNLVTRRLVQLEDRLAPAISLAGPGYGYVQDFNTLANSGTNATLPVGWDIAEALTGADTLYTADDGNSAMGDTYSYGTGTSTERGLGGLQTASLNPTFGAGFVNDTGSLLDSIAITFTGEQWRLGATGRTDRLDFQYSTDATSLTTGTWVDANQLDFTAPVTSGSVGAFDGNSSVNRRVVVGSFNGLAVPVGGTFWIRWTDFDATGDDDGLAVDDFTLTTSAKVGSEFLVNTTTAGAQEIGLPGGSVAMDPAGNAFVVWKSPHEGSNSGIYGQRYDATGSKFGGEFRVNSYTTDEQANPAVAVDADGDAIVVWRSFGQDGAGWGIFGQRYDATGTKIGGEFRVNTHTTANQEFPAVAVDADGDAIIAWMSYGQDGSDYGIYAQRYDATGAKVGGEFRVNSHVTNGQTYPAVAVDADGDTIIAWMSYGQDGSVNGIYGQRYDAAGVALGGEFQVNTYTANNQSIPRIAVGSDGGAVIVWQSNAQDGSGFGIFGQRFSAAGAKLGGEFSINTYTTGTQISPSVAADADGNVIVVWRSDGQDGSGSGVFGQRYDTAGTKVGGEFQVNTHTTNNQLNPSVAANADGDAVVVWQSDGQDGSSWGVFGQQLIRPNPDLVAPNVSLSSSAPASTNTSPILVTALFTENVIGFDATDLTLVNATVSNFAGSGISYTFDLVPNSQGTVSVSIAAGKATDGAGNGNTPSNLLSRVYDTVAPGVTLASSAMGTTLGAFAVTATFTESVTGFDATDVTVNAGLVSDFSGSGANYSFTVTPTLAGNVDVSVAAGKAADAATNSNTASNILSRFAFVAGSAFPINTTTAASQFAGEHSRSVAVDAAGNAFVVWRSSGQDGSGWGIYGQRFNAAGAKVGGEFLINTYTTNDQLYPTVAVDADGDAVVVWSSSGQDSSGDGIYGQRFSATGAKVGSEFRVSTYAFADQSNPSVSVDAAGNAVVAWVSDGQDGGGWGVYGQRLDAAGAKVGGEFQVNSYATGDQLFPSVAVDADGDSVVVWESVGQDGSNNGIYGQRFDSAGAKVGGEFQVNTYTNLDQRYPSVAVDAAGNAVAVWTSNGQDGNNFGIFGQRLDTTGAKVGGEFQVNTYTTARQYSPVVSVDADGDAVIVWPSFGQDGSNYGIYGQRFNSVGTKVGGEFRVNTYTANSQYAPSVAVDADGDAMIVWMSDGEDGSFWGVFGRQSSSPNPTTGVTSIVIADGSAQRSTIREITVPFSSLVNFPTDKSSAFALTRTGPGSNTGPVTITVDTSGSTPTQTIARLTFSGTLTEFGSLVDGNYSLQVFGDLLTDSGGQLVDADNNGLFGGTFTTTLHRLFGDADGNASVTAVDFNAFRLAYGTMGMSIFDFDNNGSVTAEDFNMFRLRYGVTV